MESVDILQYKNFIREQDAKMTQFVTANNQLHAELTNVRAMYEEAAGQVQILQDQNAILQAQAVNGGEGGVPSPDKVTSSSADVAVNHADSLKMDDFEKQLRFKDEHIAELEARLTKEDGEMNEKLLTVVAYNQSQTIEIQTLKKQLEGLREIMMGKDEQIMKLKNDLPMKPKSGAPQDRFENMFMTSLELEAHKKKLVGVELEARLQELENIKIEQEKEIKDLTSERNSLEKDLLDTRHKVDDLEEIVKNQGNQNYFLLEQELRDARCKIEELKENRDSASLQVQDSAMMDKLLRESEQKLHQTTEQLQVSQQQLYTLSVSYEQLRLSKVSEVSNDNTENGLVTELRSKLDTAEQSIKSINSEQEDLLGLYRFCCLLL